MQKGPAEVDGADPRPVIEVGARFQGLVLLLAPARIDGRVDGRVEAAAELCIGAGGCVIGPVESRDAVVAGRVEGDVRARDRIVLEATAHVRGELSAPRLVLREGSFLEGACQSGSAVGCGPASEQTGETGQTGQIGPAAGSAGTAPRSG